MQFDDDGGDSDDSDDSFGVERERPSDKCIEDVLAPMPELAPTLSVAFTSIAFTSVAFT